MPMYEMHAKHILTSSQVHPGMVDTGIFRGSGADPSQLPMDTGKLFLVTLRMFTNCFVADLCADFLVWLTQPKTKFLNGKMVWANWDVEELEARAGEIQSSATMTVGVAGWPFSPASTK
jgi:hypothetical protein